MRYAKDVLGGWLAIGAAIALIPEVALFLLLDNGLAADRWLLVAAVAMLATRIFCLSYALLRFRALLVRVFAYHGLDIIVPALIALSVALVVAQLLVRLPVTESIPNFGAMILLTTGVPLGVLSFMTGWRLLRLGVDIGEFGRPYAWTCIVAPLCFATVIGAPIGVLVLAAGSVLLGLTLLRGPVEGPEFV